MVEQQTRRAQNALPTGVQVRLLLSGQHPFTNPHTGKCKQTRPTLSMFDGNVSGPTTAQRKARVMHALNDHGTTVILGTLRRERDWAEPVTVSGEGEWMLNGAEAGDD